MSTPIKIQAAGVYLQATSSAGDRVAMPGFGAGAQVLVYNDSAALAFVEFGTSDVAATGGDVRAGHPRAAGRDAGPDAAGLGDPCVGHHQRGHGGFVFRIRGGRVDGTEGTEPADRRRPGL